MDEQLQKRGIHPAVDVTDKLFYGLYLPVTSGESISEDLVFITSDQECFEASDEELARRNLELVYPSVLMRSRWSIPGIRNFLSTGSNSSNSSICSICFGTVRSELTKFIEFDDSREYSLITLWIMGTYLLPIWNSYPYIGISGTKRTGKSKLLKFTEMLAFNSMFSVNISTASLYRLVQSLRCSLLLDESEALSTAERKMEIKNILYAGYKKYGYVFRSDKTVEGRVIPTKFEVFSPKIFVTFTGLEDILADRSIIVVMLRSINKEIINSEIVDSDKKWQELRDKLYSFSISNWKEIKKLYDEFEEIEGIEGRFRELWKPILVLAKFVGNGVYDDVVSLAVNKIKEQTEEDVSERREIYLLQGLIPLVTEDRFYSLSEIKDSVLNSIAEEDVQWLTNKWIGRALSKMFKISERRKVGRRWERRILPSQVRSLARRFGLPSPISMEQMEQMEQMEEYSDSMIMKYISDVIDHGENRISAIVDAVKNNLGITDEKRILRLVTNALETPKKLFGVEMTGEKNE